MDKEHEHTWIYQRIGIVGYNVLNWTFLSIDRATCHLFHSMEDSLLAAWMLLILKSQFETMCSNIERFILFLTAAFNPAYINMTHITDILWIWSSCMPLFLCKYFSTIKSGLTPKIHLEILLTSTNCNANIK